uniref:Uncharacterized protein n=1 Tax=Leersia perrieri TaxID=77586 RepID=A0A0D9WM16_9ORYZ
MRRRQRDLPPASAAGASTADRERLLAEEVFYLHSLWRRGPPSPAPAPAPIRNPIPTRGSGSAATRHTNNRRKRRKLERRAREQEEEEEQKRRQQQQSGMAWPLAPSPSASPTSWHDATASSSQTQQHHHPPRSPGSLAQQSALRAAEEFFSTNHEGSESEGSESEEEDSESEDGYTADEAAAGFFMGLFERDAALRGHYERRWVRGEFACMACVGRKWRKGKTRRYAGCVGLVQHARAATRCGRPRAHRALAAAVCRVLGWDVERLPSVVIDPRGTLGQALAAAAAGGGGAQEEDVDPGNKDGSLDNVVAMKANVNVGTSSSLVNDNNGES